MSGDELRLDRETAGDAVLFGGKIRVLGPVRGDGVVAGRELELRGPFDEDLYAAGARVRLEGDVGGNARLAGADVVLGPRARVAGGVSVAAANVEVEGSVGQYLQIAAGKTVVSGRVGGDVHVTGGELDVTPSAQIDGTLIFTGPEPASVAPGARVSGEIRHVPSTDVDGSAGWLGSMALLAAVPCIGLTLLGAITWALSPRFTQAAMDVIRRRTGASLLAGLGVAWLSPLVIALLAISIIGIPLAIVALCTYVALFPLGYVLAASTIAEKLYERVLSHRPSGVAQRALALVATLLLLTVFAFVPLIGPLTIAALALIGIGALTLTAIDARRRGSPLDDRVGADPSVRHSHDLEGGAPVSA